MRIPVLAAVMLAAACPAARPAGDDEYKQLAPLAGRLSSPGIGAHGSRPGGLEGSRHSFADHHHLPWGVKPPSFAKVELRDAPSCSTIP